MKTNLFIALVTSLLLLNFSSTAQSVKLIFDTDMESDVDDVGALAMLHALADNGEVDILATIVCSLNPWAVPTVDALNTYFNRPDLPIAAVKNLGVYRNSKYAKIISEEFPQDAGLGEEAEDAIDLYRRILAEQPDKSVTIVTVGYLTNLSYLLQSGPDEYSGLTGRELVEKKVKHLVCMGGRYPYHQNYEKWGNFKPDPDAVIHVARVWPTKIIFTGGGAFADLMKTGKTPFNYELTSNPVSRAYDIYLNGWRDWHHSADLIAVYVAVRGWEEFFELTTVGYNHIFEDGTLMWRLQPDDPRHNYINDLKEGVEADEIAKVFDDLMVQSIRAKRIK